MEYLKKNKVINKQNISEYIFQLYLIVYFTENIVNIGNDCQTK